MRRISAVFLALSLSDSIVAARASSLAVITYANQAYVGTTSASQGTTLYDGDRLSTDSRGRLTVRSATGATLQMEPQTHLVLRNAALPQAGMSVELLDGTLVFSAERVTTLDVQAQQASIRPGADVSTIAHVRIVTPKELRIFARRGAVEISYAGEHAIIAEGLCYRVLLDPGENDRLGAEPKAKGPLGTRKRLLLILVSSGAAVAIWEIIRNLESPHRP